MANHRAGEIELTSFLTYLRTSRGLSQAELGQLCGVRTNAICQFELGQAPLVFQDLRSLATFFGVSLDALARNDLATVTELPLDTVPVTFGVGDLVYLNSLKQHGESGITSLYRHKQAILSYLTEHGTARMSNIATAIGVSRTQTSALLSQMLDDGTVVSKGTTGGNKMYGLPSQDFTQIDYKQHIIEYLSQHETAACVDIATSLGISHGWAHNILRKMILSGEICSEGQNKGRTYRLNLDMLAKESGSSD